MCALFAYFPYTSRQISFDRFYASNGTALRFVVWGVSGVGEKVFGSADLIFWNVTDCRFLQKLWHVLKFTRNRKWTGWKFGSDSGFCSSRSLDCDRASLTIGFWFEVSFVMFVKRNRNCSTNVENFSLPRISVVCFSYWLRRVTEFFSLLTNHQKCFTLSH